MQNEFDDPVLKSALKRACGGETAPPALRDRVERALALEADKLRLASRKAFDWRRNPLVGLAAAALIIVSFGFLFMQYQQSEPQFVQTLPNDIAGEMTAAHDAALAQAARHNLPVPKDDLNQIRKTLKERLGHPVLVASLGPEWKFEGASIAKVGRKDASQLLFTKGSETVSIISVAVETGGYYSPEEGAEYSQTFNNHPLAGVVKDGVIHCVIGSRGSTLSEKTLRKLRDKVRDLIAVDTSNQRSCRTVAAAAGM